MAILIASPAKMALKLQELEEKIEILNEQIVKMQGKAEAQLETLKVKNGRRTKKNN
jgi:hypothetical protein